MFIFCVNIYINRPCLLGLVFHLTKRKNRFRTKSMLSKKKDIKVRKVKLTKIMDNFPKNKKIHYDKTKQDKFSLAKIAFSCPFLFPFQEYSHVRRVFRLARSIS